MMKMMSCWCSGRTGCQRRKLPRDQRGDTLRVTRVGFRLDQHSGPITESPKTEGLCAFEGKKRLDKGSPLLIAMHKMLSQLRATASLPDSLPHREGQHFLACRFAKHPAKALDVALPRQLQVGLKIQLIASYFVI